jgi:hemolysin activation/secretion protein
MKHWLIAMVCVGFPVCAAAATEVPSPPVEANPAFDIMEFRVLGSTVLTSRQIEEAVYPFLGPGKSLTEVQKARDALADVYRRGGFGAVSVDIPEQAVDDGIVRLAVTEGRVDRVEVKGAQYFSGREIRNALPSIRPGSVPNLTAFQGELADLSQTTADRTVTPTLRAGRAPGLVDVTLNVKDEAPVHGSLEVNDRATADTSRTRLSATLSYDYLFGRPQSLSVQYQTAPEEPSEVKAWAFTWVNRLGGDDSWIAYFVDSKSDVAALGTVSVLGSGTVLGLRRNFSVLAPSEGSSLNASIGVDYKSFDENIFVTSTDESRTPLSYAVFSADSGGYLQSEKWRLDGNGSLQFGLRGLANDEQDFAFKRYQAHASFAYLRGQFRLARALPFGTSAALRVSGQYSPAPLVSNEQFSLGGVDTIRGYLEAESLSDTGVAASFELGSPRWTIGAGGQHAFALSTLAFMDAGVGTLEDPLPGQARRMDLSSYGAALLMSGPMHLDARLDWARALVPGSRTNERDSRIHFMFRVGF